jgi:hypothetical protein
LCPKTLCVPKLNCATGLRSRHPPPLRLGVRCLRVLETGPYDLKRRVAYWRAEEPAAVVRDFEKPACPTPRIAADLRVRQIADNAQRLVAGGRPVREIDPFVVTHHALTEAEIEKIAGPDTAPSPRRTTRWLRSPLREHRDSIPEGAGPAGQPSHPSHRRDACPAPTPLDGYDGGACPEGPSSARSPLERTPKSSDYPNWSSPLARGTCLCIAPPSGS